MQSSSHDYNTTELATEEFCIFKMDIIILIQGPEYI